MQVKVNYHRKGQIWYIHLYNGQGQLHAEGAPTVQYWDENGQEYIRAYYINGQRHSTEGPAIQKWFSGGKERYRAYYINGELMTEEEWEKLCK